MGVLVIFLHTVIVSGLLLACAGIISYHVILSLTTLLYFLRDLYEENEARINCTTELIWVPSRKLVRLKINPNYFILVLVHVHSSFSSELGMDDLSYCHL